MLVRDQRGSFRHDEFLALMAHPTRIKFSAYEHAPAEERRDRFREALSGGQLPLTFIETGINIRVDLATKTTAGTSTNVDFETAAFVFSGVWVRLKGHIDGNDLDGQARLELYEAPEETEEVPALSSDQLRALRNLGLPV